ncbi:ATP-binding protein [Enterobacter sp. SECR19-1250]|uniref:ATP-binding protein n=1 Tax=Enterobacter sp. SECR19-1250 TaxID=2749084 RepID=UPI0015B3F9D0|nr:ATP-binding protein [Enterobacter sp. SECR19-1250]NWJ78833.1 ATP-binding protein [Enterobacter sp. SECR19-1250]
MNIRRLVFAIEDIMNTFSRFTVAADFVDYCDLRTVIGLDKQDLELRPWLQAPYIAVTHQGYYLSAFEIAGALRDMDEEAPAEHPDAFEGMILHLATTLSTTWKHTGHKMAFIFERDPEKGASEITTMIAPQKRAIQHVGIQLDDLLEEKITTLSPWLVRERCWLAVWSSPSLVSQQERVDFNKGVLAINDKAPLARYGQQPWRWLMSGLKIRHDSFITTLEKALGRGGEGLLVRLMDIPEVCNEIRREMARDSTSAQWRPHLPGDAVPAGVRQDGDNSTLLAPFINLQVFGGTPKTEGNLIHAEGLWHGMVAITLPPQRPEPFNQLVKNVPRAVPWRIRIDVMPGGMKALGGKKTLSSFGQFIPSIRPLYDSVMQLAQVDEKDPVCVMTIVATTWGKTREICSRNQMLLESALQGWGVCSTTTTFGDPRRGWVNSMLAAAAGSGPTPLYPPLSHALSMLPFNRPGSVWRGEGNLMLHTEDGCAWEVGLASSRQNKHTELAPGDSGLGKSVLINTLTEIQVSSAQVSLPYVAHIDKGFSGMGTIQLIRDCLPEGRKDEAIGIVLSNDPSQSRNIFDILYGAREPVTPEKQFICSMLTAFCIEPDKGVPPNTTDTRQVMDRLTELAFDVRSGPEPNMYRVHVEPDVDQALLESGLWEQHDPEWWAATTWYEVRDILHDKGQRQAAQRAHYQAVPELADMPALLKSEAIQETFGEIQRDGSQEKLLSYIERCLIQARQDYPMLASRTRFALNPDTRIVTVDLNNVAGDKTPAGRLKTGIMYLFAGHITAGDFILPQYREEVMKVLPEAYHAGILRRINQLDSEMKTKIYDELHNAKGIDFIFESLDTQDREQRKFGIRTVLSTQFLTDYPKSLLDSANTLWLLRYRQEDIPILRDAFKVPEHTLQAFLRMPAGPAADGSGVSMLCVMRTTQGVLARIVRFTIGPLELWSLNSDKKDSALRRHLTNALGSARARRLLATTFPRGSAKKYIETRERKAGARGDKGVIEVMAEEMVNELGYNL